MLLNVDDIIGQCLEWFSLHVALQEFCRKCVVQSLVFRLADVLGRGDINSH